MIEFKEISLEVIDECALLYVETFNSEPWNDKWEFDTAYNRLKDIYNTPGFYGLIAVEDGIIIAAVFGCTEFWYEGKTYDLKEMFVKNGLRGKGIGSKLLETLNTRLLSIGVNATYLFTAEGDMTEKFYRKNGYERIEGMIMMSGRVRH